MNSLTPSQRARFFAQIAAPNERGCALWIGRKRSGKNPANTYGRPSIGGVTQNAHHVAYELSMGPVPLGMKVLHRCDTPLCVNPAHLFLGTQADNMADCGAKGRSNKHGRNNGRALLSPDDVYRIRTEATDSDSMNVLAIELGVSRSTIYAAATGRRWKHLQPR